MLILSKYKDYYDYLSGVYGVDPKIVLDRRDYTPVGQDYLLGEGVIQVYLCGKVYSGIYGKDRKIYWGEEMRKFEVVNNKKNKWSLGFHGKYGSDKRYILTEFSVMRNSSYVNGKTYRYESKYLNIVGVDDEDKLNEKYNCPIILIVNSLFHSLVKYPVLSEIEFNRMVPPMDIYLMLSEYLAPKDKIEDNQTDKEKIVSKGFDIKTSFRKM